MANRSRPIGASRSMLIGANRSRPLGVNRSMLIGANRKTPIGANRKRPITNLKSSFLVRFYCDRKD